MKTVALLFLLSVFAVAACSSGEVKEVVLTPSEQGTLQLTDLTPSQLATVGMVEHPGYANTSAFNRRFPSAEFELESLYLAGYETSGREISLATMVVTSGNVNAALEFFGSESFVSEAVQDGSRYSLLHKGNVFVLISLDSESDLPPISDVADKLSRRLGMDVLDLN